MNSRSWLLTAAVAAPALSSAIDAAAQTAATPVLEEILVTAQKREEKILDVPISITAVTGQQLDATGGQSLAALQGSVPGLFVANGGAYGATPIGIRGATGVATTFGDEPVALYVDGVYRARAGFLGASGMLDVASIEIVRGPQGTFGVYGRNLTDDRSVTNEGNTFSYPLASFNKPRTIGVFFEKNF